MPNPEQPMQENLADVKEPQQQNVEGLEIAKTPELEKVVDAANVLAGKIERDEKVTKGEVDDLREALGQMKLNVAGIEMTLEEAKTKGKFYIEFLQGKFEHHSELTILTPEMAQIIADSHRWFSFPKVTEISDETANILGRHDRDLNLSGLTSLTDSAARALARHKGNMSALGLSGLTEISDEAARWWGMNRNSRLFFNGVTTLSGVAAARLSAHESDLYLEKLVALPEDVAEGLGRFGGYEYNTHILDLSGVEDLSAESAKNLVSNPYKKINLGLKNISDEVAEHLGKLKGDLHLESLTEISLEAAEGLSHIEGALVLSGLTSISDDIAKKLAKVKGALNLQGLKELTPDVASALATHTDEDVLWLPKLPDTPKEVEEILADKTKKRLVMWWK
ncbi:MAG: hypothetical protein WC663_02420 [Patescibacteria group bacterium]